MKTVAQNPKPSVVPKKRVVLIDHQLAVREMTAVYLKGMPEVEVVAELGGGCEALRACRGLKPDVVVMELGMPDLQGIFVIHALRESLPGLRVVVFTSGVNDELMRGALAEGLSGFVRKVDRLEELGRAMVAALSGGRYECGYAALLRALPQAKLSLLTTTELAVLQMIAGGMMTKEIAEVLDAKPKTVDHHRQHLMNKLGIHDVASLTRFAIIEGLGGV